MPLYRFHFDIDAFPFDDWSQLRSTIFKDVGEFKIVVLETAVVTSKRHYQGVAVLETPKATLESRIKKSKLPGAKRGCYSLALQNPSGVEGYYNYLCKGEEYGTPPDVLESKFSAEELATRHENYHKRIQDTSELDKKIMVRVQSIDERAFTTESRMCATGDHANYDPRVYLKQMWEHIYKECIDYMMETNPNGFVMAQVERLAFKSLTNVIKALPEKPSLARDLPHEIAMKRAGAFI
ncbi:MAG: hypothetical protein [Circular genetic element sp.]|nr:MAG: hypothetical protein [Circular genetic element sp.]